MVTSNAAFPSLMPEIRKWDTSSPEATMPFIKHLAKRFGFDIQDEWDRFLGRPTKSKLVTANEKYEHYVSQFEIILNKPKQSFLVKSRKREVMGIKHMLVYVCYMNKIAGLEKMAKIVGYKHHSSILHSVECVGDYLYSNDIDFMPIYNATKHLIENEA